MKKASFSVLLLTLIFSGVIVTIFAYYAFHIPSQTYNPKFSDTTPLGNRLSAYFYFINTDDVEIYSLIRQHKLSYKMVSNPELKLFYKNWSWRRKKNAAKYKSLPRAAWSQIDPDGVIKPNYLTFWENIRPSINKFYKQRLPAVNIEVPIVHFRCSDSPFNKHVQYHLTKKNTVRWMAEQIKSRGYNKATLLSCNQHRSLDQNSCTKYIDFYTKIFNDNGISVTTQCNSILEDFSAMVQSPILVALNTSSFSFMAGIAKNPSDFISCNMGTETKNDYILQNEADWIMSNDKPLLHKDVIDYNDTKEVIEKLLN